MRRPPVELLVLDAHGVIFNNPFPTFLKDLAAIRNERPRDLLGRWTKHIRTPAWTGRLSDTELWRQLAVAGNPDDWRAKLEAMYAPGPAAPHLVRWASAAPIWVLSNHRSHWLLPRLDRFALTPHFQRVVVSDAVGAAKPDLAIFETVLDSGIARSRVLFVDDHRRNLKTARRLGFQTMLADASASWLATVDRALGLPGGAMPAVHTSIFSMSLTRQFYWMT